MYKLFAFLFFAAASLLGASVILWSVVGLPISVVLTAVVVGGVIYISFATSFIASRFLAVRKNLLELPWLKKVANFSAVRVACDTGLLLATLVTTLFILLSAGSWLVSHVVLPVFIETALKPTLSSMADITSKITKVEDRLATVEFFSRNKYSYNLSDNFGDYKLEFAGIEKDASSSATAYRYDFKAFPFGWMSWNQTWDAIKLWDFETVTGFKVSKIYYLTLSNPLLKVVVDETSNSADSNGNGHTFLLYPSQKGANSYYTKLSGLDITRGVNIETAADTDGYPLVTIRYSGWRSGDSEKYKLELDTSEGTDEIIPKLITN